MSVVVLIDGSNVARCSAWRAASRGTSDHDLRRTLVDAVAGWIAAAADADHVQLVFDGAGPWAPGRTRITPHVTVVGSGGDSGDDMIIELARVHGAAGDQIWTVTSDREVRDVAGARAQRHLDADSFVALIASRATTQHQASSPPPMRRGIAELVDDDVRARLERLRRGE